MHVARWKYRTQKNRHFGTIAQLCRAISLELRHVSTIVKNLLNNNTSSTCPDNMVNLRPAKGWDLLASLRHPCKFQRVSRLGSVTARHSSSGRQPNFAAFNRGRHLYSAGRPSGWALAHILVSFNSLQILHVSRTKNNNRAEGHCLVKCLVLNVSYHYAVFENIYLIHKCLNLHCCL